MFMKDWLKKSWGHKKESLSPQKLLEVAKSHGLPLVIIIVAWEIIEDVLFPALFFLLGMHVNPLFLGLIPVSWLLCLHWIAVPALWWVWLKIARSKKKQHEDDIRICDHHDH